MSYLLEFFDVHSWVEWRGDILHGLCEVWIPQRLEKIVCLLLAQGLESICQLFHFIESRELIGELFHVLATPPTKGLQHQPKSN